MQNVKKRKREDEQLSFSKRIRLDFSSQDSTISNFNPTTSKFLHTMIL